MLITYQIGGNPFKFISRLIKYKAQMSSTVKAQLVEDQ